MNMNNTLNYNKSLEYWSEIPATVDGVLGGFGFISNCDIEGSKLFLNKIFSMEKSPSKELALEGGAGIGRISKFLLVPYFDSVDVIEPNIHFAKAIRDYVDHEKHKIGTIYEVGLQDFNPDKKYDVIWNQWVLGYLKDKDLVQYLQRCRDALTSNGVIIVKENVTSSGVIEKDEADSSVTRPLQHFLKIFKQANLKRIKQSKQTNFPNGIYPVYMFALIPSSR